MATFTPPRPDEFELDSDFTPPSPNQIEAFIPPRPDEIEPLVPAFFDTRTQEQRLEESFPTQLPPLDPATWSPEALRKFRMDILPNAAEEEGGAKGRTGSAAASFMAGGGVGTGQTVSALARLADMLSASQLAEASGRTGIVNPKESGELLAEAQRRISRTPEEREREIAADPVTKFGQELAAGAKEAFPENPKFKGEFFASTIPSSAGQMVPTIAAGMVNPVLAAGQYGLSSGQAGVEESIAAGDLKDPDKVFLAYLGLGAISEFALGVPANVVRYLRAARAGGVDKTAARETIQRLMLKGGASEAGQETLEQTGQNLVAQQTFDPNRKLMEGVPESAAAGALLGGGVSGVAAATGAAGEALRDAAQTRAPRLDLGDFNRRNAAPAFFQQEQTAPPSRTDEQVIPSVPKPSEAATAAEPSANTPVSEGQAPPPPVKPAPSPAERLAFLKTQALRESLTKETRAELAQLEAEEANVKSAARRSFNDERAKRLSRENAQEERDVTLAAMEANPDLSLQAESAAKSPEKVAALDAALAKSRKEMDDLISRANKLPEGKERDALNDAYGSALAQMTWNKRLRDMVSVHQETSRLELSAPKPEKLGGSEADLPAQQREQSRRNNEAQAAQMRAELEAMGVTVPEKPVRAENAQTEPSPVPTVETAAVARAAAPVPFSPRAAIPVLENRISELHSLLINSDAFSGSEFYDRSFPIPREGGIIAAKSSDRYRTDPVFAGKVDAAVKDITDTMVTANRQRMTLMGRPSTGSFGVDYSIQPEKARAGYTVNVVRAWHNEAKQKYPYTRNLGNISVREAFQNSLDAVMAAMQLRQIKQGSIKIDTQTHNRQGFIVDDNGVGMSDEDIGNKFLSLHSTGKAVQGRFGGFGIAKAVILGPADSGTWKLHTRDNEFTHEAAQGNEVVGSAPLRQGTRIEVTTNEEIIDSEARQYVETTDLPKNVAVEFDGETLTNPFKGRKPTRETVKVNDETSYELSYYKNAPTGYDSKYIIRLVDAKTGARLTQAIRDAGSDGFHGVVVVDITTSAVPGTSGYPLVDSRMEMKWDAERPVRKLIEKNTIDPLSGSRDNEARFVTVLDRPEWAETRRKTAADAGYQRLMSVINKVWEETGHFFGTADTQPVTPLWNLSIKIDKGFSGYSGGSMFQAKHLAAYEAVARLMSKDANAPVTSFYGLLSKASNGGVVNAEHGYGGSMGLNFLLIDKTSLKNPWSYALYLRDLIAHELTHAFQGPHNEQFTSKEIELQRQTSHLFPMILRIAEATIGKEVGKQVVEKRVEVKVPVRVEVPVEKLVEKYLTLEQRQFIYDNAENLPTGQAKDDLYYPIGSTDVSQQWLVGPGPGERITGFSGPPENIGIGSRTEQPSSPSPARPEPGSVVAGGSDVEEVVAPSQPSVVDRTIVKIEDLQKKLRGSGSDVSMGVPKAILDLALEAARLALKAGKTIAEAIDAAIAKIRESIATFDEAEVRQSLEQELAQEPVAGEDLQHDEEPRFAELEGEISDASKPVPGEGRTVSEMFGVKHTYEPAAELGPDGRVESAMQARDLFMQSGLDVVQEGQRFKTSTGPDGYWRLRDAGTPNESAGERLLEKFNQANAALQADRGEAVASGLMGNAINSIRNIVTNMNADEAAGLPAAFSQDLRARIMAAAQGEARIRGQMLAALRGKPLSLVEVAQNFETELRILRFNELGGAELTPVMKKFWEVMKEQFSDSELAEIIKANPRLADFVEEMKRQAAQETSGTRFYRRVQNLYNPSKPKSLKQLLSQAREDEKLSDIVAELEKLYGVRPVKKNHRKLSPMDKLLHYVKPETAAKIEELTANAVAEAEQRAGEDAVIAREPDAEAQKALREQARAGELEVTPDDIEEGLNLPKHRHWKLIRESLLGYSPTTLKAVQDLIASDFSKARFKTPEAKAPDVKIDLGKLAVSPEQEVNRVLDNYLAGVELAMEIEGAAAETQLRVLAMAREQVSAQIERIRRQIRDVALAERSGKPVTTDNLDAIRRLANAGIFADERLGTPEIVRRLSANHAVTKLLPTINDLVAKVFELPPSRQAEFAERFAADLARRLNLAPDQESEARRVFGEAFGKKLAEARKRALERAVESLAPTERKLKEDRSLWQKIERFVNAGGFDTDGLLRELAAAKGWKIPTADEIAQMREWAVREEELRRLPREQEEDLADQPQGLAEALREKFDATSDERSVLKQKMQTMWSRMTLQVNFLKHWRDPTITYNNARALLEYSQANTLARATFVPRQFLDVASFGLLNLITRPYAHATARAKANEDISTTAEYFRALGEAIQSRWNFKGAGWRASAESLKGRGLLKQYDLAMSRIGFLDRLVQKADEQLAKGNYGGWLMYQLIAIPRVGFKIVSALDLVQAVPIEFQELRHQFVTQMIDNGATRAQVTAAEDVFFANVKGEFDNALLTAEQIFEQDGIKKTGNALKNAAWHILRGRMYARLKLDSREGASSESDIKILMNTVAWNERLEGGPGYIFSKGGHVVQEFGARTGLPLPAANFGNAMGIALNRMLSVSGGAFFHQYLFKGDPFFRTEKDIAQRKAEAVFLMPFNVTLFYLAATGVIIVLGKWPDDKKEREEWQAKGWEPGTMLIPTGDGRHIPVSTRTGPGFYTGPWVTAGGAIHKKFADWEQKNERLKQEAQEKGLAFTPLPKPTATAVVAGLWGALQQSMVGGRTASGAMGSLTDYGQFDEQTLKRVTAANVAPLVPLAPGAGDLLRLAGMNVDPKLASFAQMIVPIPDTGTQRLNALGDPVGTMDDVQRVVSKITGGTVPWPVSGAFQAPDKIKAYQNYFESDYSVPAISAGKNYKFGDRLRPMTDEELKRYAAARGKNFASELQTVDVNGLAPAEAKRTVQAAFQRANADALESVGATPPARTSAAGSVSAPERSTGASTLSPRRSTGRLRASLSRRTRTPALGRVRSRIGRTRLATMRVPILRRSRLRASLSRPRRGRFSVRSRMRRRRVSYV